MVSWGSYESVKELAQSGVGMLWSARPAGSVSLGEKFIIKTTEGLALLGDSKRLQSESALFVESARQQKELVGKGALRWAPIHEHGQTDSGAFYVSDLYQRSAQKIVARGVRADAKSLRQVILGVVDGLLELRQNASRPHGNIKPSNVLIGGPDGPTFDTAPIYLTDPKPASVLAPGDADEDRRAIGRLIYELVMLRPPRDAMGITVSLSPDWARLGSAADPWIDLCNRLLDPTPGRPAPDLDEIRALIPSGASLGGGMKGIAVATALVLLAAGGIGAYAVIKGFGKSTTNIPTGGNSDGDGNGEGSNASGAPMSPTPELVQGWAALVNDWGRWYKHRESVLRELENLPKELRDLIPVPLREALAIRELKSPAELVQASETDRDTQLRKSPSTWANDPVLGTRTGEIVPRADKTRAGVSQARIALVEWTAPERLEAWVMDWESRGWGEASKSLDESSKVIGAMIAGTDTGDARTVPQRIASALGVIAHATRIAQETGKADQLVKDLASASPEDRVLAGFAQVLSVHAARSFRGDAPDARFASLHSDLRFAITKGDAALAKVKDPKWDAESFHASDAYKSLAAPGAALDLDALETWLREARDTRYAALDATPFETWRAAFAKDVDRVKAEVTSAAQNPKRLARWPKESPRAAMDADLDAIRTESEGVGTRLVSSITLPKAEAAQKALADRLARVVKAIPAESEFATIETLITHMRSKTFTSPALQGRWKTLVDGAGSIEGGPSGAEGVLNPHFAALQALDARLKPIEGTFEAVDRLALDKAVADRRERAMGEIAPKLLPQKGLSDPAVAPVIAQYEEWLATSVALVAQAGEVPKRNALGFTPSERDSGGKTLADLVATGNDPAFASLAPALKPARDLVANLSAIASEQSASVLLARVDQSSNRELGFALAAWESLASRPWAGDPALFQSAARLATAFGARIQGAQLDVQRAPLVQSRVAGASRAIWTAYLKHACSTADDNALAINVQLAIDHATDFGAGIADARSAGPAAEYNWLFANLRASIAGVTKGDDVSEAGAVKALHDPFAARAASLGLAGSAGVSAFLKDLATGCQVNAGPSFVPENSGPMSEGSPFKGSAGVKTGDGWLEYTIGNHTIEFRLISPNDGTPPVYLATREVSLGLFIDAFKIPGRGGDLGATRPSDASPLLEIPGTVDDDTRKGPRVWTLAQGFPIASSANARRASSLLGWYLDHTTLVDFNTPAKGLKYLPEGVTVTAPTPAMPMQYISPESAVLCARVLGCRLPTSAEWRAARDVSPGTNNLRDATWKRAFDHITQTKANFTGAFELEVQYPGSGAFWPLGFRANAEEDPVAGDSNPATTESDGVLFFRDASRPATQPDGACVDLVGNVAEFVFDAPEEIEKIALPGSPDAVITLNPSGSDKLFVIGASALSPASVPGGKTYKVDEPYRVESAALARRGYSDVGFRLAISALGAGPTGTPLERAQSAIAKRGKYIKSQ